MWWRCLTRATFALMGFGLLGMVTSAAAQPPGLASAWPGSARVLAAKAPNPMEADMVALVTALPDAVAPPAAAAAPPVAHQVAAAAAPAAAPPPAAPPQSPSARAVETALRELGKPYRYGALGPSTFDCSGLTKFAYRAAGIELPHSAAAQYGSGRRVNRNQLEPGDLIFWRGLGHVGMYIGGGRMVHAPQTGDVVTITSIDQGRYLGAVRPGA
jgi:cell wall-associated NlpC family hydrolase